MGGPSARSWQSSSLRAKSSSLRAGVGGGGSSRAGANRNAGANRSGAEIRKQAPRSGEIFENRNRSVE